MRKKKTERKSEIEKLMLSDFESFLQADYKKEISEISSIKKKIRRSARYYAKKGDLKTFNAKVNSLLFFSEKERTINESYGYSPPEKRHRREIEQLENNFDSFFADFEYNDRKGIYDFCFKNAQVKTYKKNKIKKVADILQKRIDYILSVVTYQELVIVQIDGSDIVSIFTVWKEDFENI